MLTILGASLLTLVMWRFTQVGPATPIWLLVLLHVVLMLGLACLFTPSFTAGLNPLPPHLYSHGSAILATLQQVAGAAGTALLIAIMASRAAELVRSGVPETSALLGGIQRSFGVAALISVAAIVCAAFMRNPQSPVEQADTASEAPATRH